MKLKFNGMMVKKGRAGCPVCGSGGTTRESFSITKRFVLPSGAVQSFRVGETYEVTEKDAKFLLSYGENGRGKNVFEVTK